LSAICQQLSANDPKSGNTGHHQTAPMTSGNAL
jgi:hypothetical protein